MRGVGLVLVVVGLDGCVVSVVVVLLLWIVVRVVVMGGCCLPLGSWCVVNKRMNPCVVD